MDKIDQAIAAAQAEPPPQPDATIGISLHTGRQVVLRAPDDMSAEELLGLLGYMSTQLPAMLERHRSGRTGPAILVPTLLRA